MDWEYVALSLNAADYEKASLCAQGWEQYLSVPWRGCIGGVRIMRRPKEEPRMWTEGEIKEIAIRAWRGVMHDTKLVKSILEDAHTEADMQVAYAKELQKRNEELRAAIDEVVKVLWEPGEFTAGQIFSVINRQLYHLASTTAKEETNG